MDPVIIGVCLCAAFVAFVWWNNNNTFRHWNRGARMRASITFFLRGFRGRPWSQKNRV